MMSATVKSKGCPMRVAMRDWRINVLYSLGLIFLAWFLLIFLYQYIAAFTFTALAIVKLFIAAPFVVAFYLKSLFESLNIPIIFVTHQYEDAKFLKGQVVVLVNGIIAQSGTYQEIIQKPKNESIKRLLTPISEQ